jgi:hypothetical protein
MAIDFATHPLKDEEKQEKPAFIENADLSPTDSSLNLDRERTLDGIDTHNTHAFMGDDSDGKVIWTLRSILAAVFLAGLYTGTFLEAVRQLKAKTLTEYRLPSHPLLYRRLPRFYRRRSPTRKGLCMATDGEHSSHCCCLSLCGVFARSFRKALYRSLWRRLHLHWLCSHGHYAIVRPSTSRHGHVWSRCSNWRIDWPGRVSAPFSGDKTTINAFTVSLKLSPSSIVATHLPSLQLLFSPSAHICCMRSYGRISPAPVGDGAPGVHCEYSSNLYAIAY